MRHFGLANPQLYGLWLAMRAAGITDAAIGRTFGVSRQYIHQKLGSQPDDFSEAVWDAARQAFSRGASIRAVQLQLRLSYPRARLLAEYLGYTPQTLAELRELVKRQQIRRDLVEYLAAGGILTTDCLRHYDAQKPYTTLFSRALRFQSLGAWRRELDVDESTPLHIPHILIRK
jgi:hypothetical protein